MKKKKSATTNHISWPCSCPIPIEINDINKEVGYLSNKRKELTEAIQNVDTFSQKKCNEYAIENFNSKKMALSYIKEYEKVTNGNPLHTKKPKLKDTQTKKFLDWFE